MPSSALPSSVPIHPSIPTQLDAVGILLDNGADVHVTDLERNSALHLAYAYGALSSALLLESCGANTDLLNGRQRVPSEEAGRQDALIPLLHSTATSAKGARTGTSK